MNGLLTVVSAQFLPFV